MSLNPYDPPRAPETSRQLPRKRTLLPLQKTLLVFCAIAACLFLATTKHYGTLVVESESGRERFVAISYLLMGLGGAGAFALFGASICVDRKVLAYIGGGIFACLTIAQVILCLL